MLTKALFTATDYLGALIRLLPPGRAWAADPDTVRYQVLSAFAQSPAALNLRALQLLIDAFPATAVELLPEWEASLGLPDPCLGPNPTIAQRQGQVMARLAQAGGQSVPFFIAYAGMLGFAITITEFTGTTALANTWQVNVPGASKTVFTASSYAGEFLSTVIEAAGVLECEFKRMAPAHTVLIWNFI